MSKEVGSSEVTEKSNLTQREHAGTVTVLHVRRWVRWWFYVGVVCGAIAVANIFLRDLTRAQVEVILFLGVVFWILGGLVCWAWEGVKIDKPVQQQRSQPAEHSPTREVSSRTITVRGGQIRLRIAHSERARLLHDYLRRWEQHHHA